jgi:AcrR family transcriptional regulator
LTDTQAAPTPPRRTRARRGEGEKLKQEIIEAAERLLVEAGSQEAVSIRAIADAVGCTPPAIYMHFADKDELFFELCEGRFALFRDYLAEARASTDDPVEALRRCGRAYIRFAMENPDQYRILFMTGPTVPDNKELQDTVGFQSFMAVIEAVQLAVDAGAIRPVDPFLTAVALWASSHGLASLMIGATRFPWPDREAIVEHQIDMLISGLLP